MKELVQIEMDESAVSYVRTILSHEKGLAYAAFNSIEDWRFFALAPDRTPLDRLKKFDEGGLCSEALSRAWLVRFCGEELRKEGKLTFVAEDLYAKPSDPWRSRSRSVLRRIFGGSVIFTTELTPGHASLVLDVLRCTRSWDIACFLVRGELDDFEIKTFVHHISFFLTMAYDQESFLIGWPARSSP